VIEENNIPPLLKAFGKNIIPVPMKALSNVKNDFVVEASPRFFVLREILQRPGSGLASLGSPTGHDERRLPTASRRILV
jgi:hypothetical protein